MNAMMLYNDKRRYKGVRLFLCVAFFYAHVLQEKQSVLHLAGPEYFPAPYIKNIMTYRIFQEVFRKVPGTLLVLQDYAPEGIFQRKGITGVPVRTEKKESADYGIR